MKTVIKMLLVMFIGMAVFTGCEKEPVASPVLTEYPDGYNLRPKMCRHVHFVPDPNNPGGEDIMVTCYHCKCARKEIVLQGDTFDVVATGVSLDYLDSDNTVHHYESDSAGTWNDDALPDGYYFITISLDGHETQYDTIHYVDGDLESGDQIYTLIED